MSSADTASTGAGAADANATITKLKEIRSRATRGQTPGKRAPTKRRTTAADRAAAGTRTTGARTASKKVTAGQNLASLMRLGSSLIEGPKPVHAAIIRDSATEFGKLLDQAAAEDDRVKAWLDRISQASGKGGLYIKVGIFSAQVVGSLALVSGVQHPLAALAGGVMAEAAVYSAAERLAAQEAMEQGRVDPEDGTPIVDPARVQTIAQALLAPQPAEEGAGGGDKASSAGPDSAR